MKTQRTSSIRRGFTLMELMVAMAITTIIVTVLVSITSIALDTWNRSRAELRASRQAKTMIDTMARDFESLVIRRGNTSEWLSALAPDNPIGGNLQSTNASDLIFFTAATDRYDGKIGDPIADRGGDVSCVAYSLEYRDPLVTSGIGTYRTFVLNRLLINPDETFTRLLGLTDSTNVAKSLDSVFTAAFGPRLSDPKNFVCENVFQFSVTFHVQITDTTQTPPTLVNYPITIAQQNSGQTTKSFTIQGTGIKTELGAGKFSAAQVASGRITAMEVSVTVISDFGIDQLRNRSFTGSQQAEFLAKHSYEFSKLVQLPTM